MGKRKIEIKKIEDVQARNVCFSKRRQGVFNKAKELSRLCGVDVHVVVFSQAGRPFTFSSAGDASLSPALHRYLLGHHGSEDHQRLVRDQEVPTLQEIIDVSAIPDSQLQSHYNALLQLKSEVMGRLEEADHKAKNHSQQHYCDSTKTTDIPPVHQINEWIRPLQFSNGAQNIQEEMPTIEKINDHDHDHDDTVPADQLDYGTGRTSDDEINNGQRRVAVIPTFPSCLGFDITELCDAQNKKLETAPTSFENVAAFANVPADGQLDFTGLINHGQQQFDSLWSSGDQECAEDADFHESMMSLLYSSVEPKTLYSDNLF